MMIHNHHSHIPANYATRIDDAAALETDTMRFLAIMSICLMAIFALIESIPKTEHQAQLAVAQPETMAQEIKEYIEQLRRRAAQLNDYIDTMVNQAAQEQRVLAARYAEARTRTAAMERRLATQQARLQRATASLQKLEHQNQAAQELQQTRKAVAAEQQRFESIRESVKPQQQSTQSQESEESTGAAVQKSLTLRFDSTAALEALVKTRKLRLFAHFGDKTWEASTSLGFTRSEMSNQTWYMVNGSVGDTLVSSFKRQVGLVTFRSPQWQVVFNDQLASQIAAMVQKHQHGARPDSRNRMLVISASGSVVYER